MVDTEEVAEALAAEEEDVLEAVVLVEEAEVDWRTVKRLLPPPG